MTYQWHVYTAVLDPVRGSEQAGQRPVPARLRAGSITASSAERVTFFITIAVYTKFVRTSNLLGVFDFLVC
jgi:hypothetical protein